MTRRVPLLTTLLLLLLACGLMSGPVSAQQFLIHNYESNLPSLDVAGVSQDHNGLMWFATRAGLMSYDGNDWNVATFAPDRMVQSIRGVEKSDDGRIYALAMTFPLLIKSFDGSQWVTLEAPPTDDWASRVIDFALNSGPDGTVQIAVTSDNVISFWNGAKWHQLGTKAQIRSLKFLQGKLYLASSEGLLTLDTDKMQVVPANIPGMASGPVQALAVTRENGSGLWLVGSGWVGIFEEGVFRLLDTELNFGFSKLETGTRALAGPAGGLFFGGAEGFFYFHPQRDLMELTRSMGFISGGISDLFLDREDNVWVTSPRGISKLVSMRIQTFDSRFGLARDEVTAIIQLGDGTMVLGHEGGLTFLNPDPVAYPITRDLPGTGRVIDLETDADGRLWIAFDQWGLALLNEDRSLQWFGRETGLPQYVYALHFDQQGVMWVGGSQGLYKKVGDSFEHVALTDSGARPDLFIRTINTGKNGSMLVSTGKLGAFEFVDGQVKWWAKSLNGIYRSCFQLIELDSGQFWVATSEGLCQIKNGELELLTSPAPEIRRPIYSILKDEFGDFWFGTDRGVMRWDGHKLTTIDNRSGILGREFNRDALMQTQDGRIWMGTDRGLSVLDFLYDQPRKAIPLAEIEWPLVDGEVVELDGHVELDPSLYELVFPFRGISFLDEKQIEFRTWLEGLEPQWQPYQEFPTRRIRYTNLPAGDYRFHVQARNSAGIQSDIVTSPQFKVGKHFSQTWWFTLIEVCSGLVVALGIFVMLMSRRYQQKLKKEVRQRTEELRFTERAVRSESRRLFSVLASISDGVLALDQGQKVVISNPMALSILGIRLDEVVGRKLSEVLTVDPPLVVDSAPNITQDSGIPVYRFTEQEGRQRFLEISVSSLVAGKESPHGWVLAFRDVTERQNREKELIRTQQLESLGVLAGGIAHDFNNLLTIMLGNLSLVEGAEVLGHEEKNRLSRMKVATLRAQSLAEQLLTFAKGGDPVMQTVDLGQLVRQSSAFALSGANVSCSIHFSDNLWPVLGDPGQLGQMVNNLLINAMQAMPDGGAIELKLSNLVRIPGSTEDRRFVCMEVIDAGPGIPQDNLEQIFNPYFTTKGTGSGLGLTIVHSIVKHHGGHIQVDSQIGSGAVFQVYLPATTTADKEIQTSISRSYPLGMRVLILDDEKDVVILAEQMLRRLGIKCVGVAHGDAAVQAFALAMGQNKPFTVFIADLTIPGGLGGVEAFRKIRAMDKTVRGIVISGYSNDTVMANFEEYGFSAAVRKPFEQDQLIESIDLAFKNSKRN